MKLQALSIPDDPAELPRWLEKQLLGMDLAALVAELTAIHGAASDRTQSTADALGGQLGDILENGLRGVSASILKRLLARPRLLLDLQEKILSQGGVYWDRVPLDSGEMDVRVERGGKRLAAYLEAQQPVETNEFKVPLRARIQWYFRPWAVSMATAAAVLLGVFVHDRYSTKGPAEQMAAEKPGWGWNREGALPQTVSAQDYLNALADAAADWYKKRPEEPSALASRIGEFRRGCSTLIFANHPPLNPNQRRWLSERCRIWAEELDSELEALERKDVDPLKIRILADHTIDKLIQCFATKLRKWLVELGQARSPVSARTLRSGAGKERSAPKTARRG